MKAGAAESSVRLSEVEALTGTKAHVRLSEAEAWAKPKLKPKHWA